MRRPHDAAGRPKFQIRSRRGSLRMGVDLLLSQTQIERASATGTTRSCLAARRSTDAEADGRRPRKLESAKLIRRALRPAEYGASPSYASPSLLHHSGRSYTKLEAEEAFRPHAPFCSASCSNTQEFRPYDPVLGHS